MACVIKANKEIASGVINTDTNTSSDSFSVSKETKNMIAVMKVSSRSAGDFTLKIEHSHDNSNWEVLKAAGAATNSNDTVYLLYSEAVDGPCLSHVRITVTSATSANATVEAQLFRD
jgi:hypothetical protein